MNLTGKFHPRGGRRCGARPEVLALEDRQLLSKVIPVTNPADSGPGTLRAAVDIANHSPKAVKIEFDLSPGETAITLTSGQLELSNTAAVTIDGPGAGQLAIDGDQNGRVFQIDPGVQATISGLTIRGGSVSDPDGNYSLSILNEGGGLYNQGAVTLTDDTVSDNDAAALGGGIFNSPSSNASLTMTDCTVTGNSAFIGGGLSNGSQSVVPGSATMTLANCTLSGNTSDNGGGGIFNSATATLTDCSVSGNTCESGSAGGVYMQQGNTLTLTDCSIDGNDGSGIGVQYGNGFTLTDCTVENNSETGVLSRFPVDTTITGCTISGNTGLYGGGLNVTGKVTIAGCTITGNTGLIYAGGVDVEYSSTATITGCTISGNAVTYPDSPGGGVQVSGGAEATITGCTISDNTAAGSNGYGGGVGIDGMATLTNCTISGNSAAAGGGVFNYGTASLVACTVSGNSAPQGGGIDNYSSPVYTSRTTLTDTIVAGNTTGIGGAAGDIGGTDPGDVTGTYNLVGTGGSGGLTAAGHNLLNVANPGLAPLGDYGGPTETMALQPNSPARHAGTPVAGVTTDQRGFPLDNLVDLGAFQSHVGPLVVNTAIDGLGSPPGELSLRQAVNLADVLTGGATITFDRSAFTRKSVITLADGPLELSNATGPVAIFGPGLGRLAVSGGGADRVFQVDQGASAVLSGLTITGGVTSDDGGGLLNLGTVTLSRDAIVGNAAADGGGIANSGTAVILGSSIDGNAAWGDGGGIFNTGALDLILSDLSGNFAGTDGGGLFNSGTAALVFCTVDDNVASAGRGIYADAAGQPVVLIGTEVKRNQGGNITGRVIRL